MRWFQLALGLIACVLAMVLPALAASEARADVLWDQYNPKATAPAGMTTIASNKSGYSLQEVADDFTVPAGAAWDVNEIEVQGVYDGGSNQATSVDVSIYSDSGGFPDALVASRPGNAYSGNPTAGDFRVGFPTVTLNSGTYWISVQANMPTTGIPTAWLWYLTNTPHGNGGVERDFHSPTSPCYTWHRIPQCLANAGPDLTFLLAGAIRYDLTYSKTGSATGTVTSNPAGINSTGTTQTARYTKGQPVDLTAVPDSSNTIIDWTGCDIESGRVCTVSMNSNRSVQANFGPAKQVQVRARGGGTGTIDSNPTRVNCGCTTQPTLYKFAEGSTVTIKAHPDSGSIVTSMTGCDAVPSRTTCTLQMNATKSVEVTFQKSKQVTLRRTGTGTGTITTDPDRGTCDPTECGGPTLFSFQANTAAVLHATAADGSVFTGWTGCDSSSGGDCTLQMDAAKSVFPDFDLDTDGDGIGNATDQCPSVAGLASNGGCPKGADPPKGSDPPPGGSGNDSKACDQARAALAKAKAKLKKLISKDAAARKTDKAKKKVKKAKKAVKKAC